MPLIGISANFKDDKTMIDRQYYNAVIFAGGIPVIIPVTTDNKILTKTLLNLHGLLLSGGVDIYPQYYAEKPIDELGEVNIVRDEYEMKLIRIAHAQKNPILGICRGMQILNVTFGGTLYQDIGAQRNSFSLTHQQSEPKNITTHKVNIVQNSHLANIIGAESLYVNSSHHQAVKRIADGFTPTAFADDGICEAIESDSCAEIAVQWHPEHLVSQEDTVYLNLFKWLIKEATKYR